MAILTIEEANKMLGLLDQASFWKTQDAISKGGWYIEVPQSKLDSLRKKVQLRAEKDAKLNLCAERNNLGIAYEKSGDIQDSIATYEENIEPGCYPARHSFDRLLVIYRKLKDYKNEKRVCKRAISVFKKELKYCERLAKIEALIAKSK